MRASLMFSTLGYNVRVNQYVTAHIAPLYRCLSLINYIVPVGYQVLGQGSW